jgi:hypothetical protein
MPNGLAIEDPSLLAMLIGEDIYVVQEKSAPAHPDVANPPASRPVLVLHDGALAPELIDLLHKILGAVGLAPADLELVPTENYEKALLDHRQYIFLFSHTELHDFVFVEKYTAWPIAGGAQLISADPLAVLAQSAPKKKQLWELLKKTFGI